MTDIYLVSGARSAIGSFQGSLSKTEATVLGTTVATAAVERAKIDPEVIDTCYYTQILPTTGKDCHSSRVVALGAGMRVSSTAANVNRLCGSGLQAIASGAQAILTGDASTALVGGLEMMSQAPYSLPGMRAGRPMGDGVVYDWLTGALSCPFNGYAMGVTAENVAQKYGISRERQDEFALQSQQRAAAAIAEGRFAEQIVGIDVKAKRETVSFEVDEHPRPSSLEKLAQLKPVFAKDGTVTAGNSSGINDASAALVMASGEAVEKHGLTPLARVAGWGIAGVPPEIMGIGPVEAVPLALAKAGLSLDDMDVIESNEAFAAQALAVQDALHLDPEKTNPDGGAIALGHPVGATGAILATKTMYHLQAHGGRYGLVTMCIGGGQGIAVVLEAVR
ncbi:acetyl-CoA C-acyltransferase [Luteococcus sp. Sow4_B9]|uniref:acetyl-CoA C-acyltransferase n=1 Tax=Luteococcus sp. Sow4_B9 TaxID=3438792 RepID=UPI003F9A893B